jgi:hypothetical protein
VQLIEVKRVLLPGCDLGCSKLNPQLLKLSPLGWFVTEDVKEMKQVVRYLMTSEALQQSFADDLTVMSKSDIMGTEV